MGKEFEQIDTCVYITDSLCCSPETSTMLLIKYTSIPKKNIGRLLNIVNCWNNLIMHSSIQML